MISIVLRVLIILASLGLIIESEDKNIKAIGLLLILLALV